MICGESMILTEVRRNDYECVWNNMKNYYYDYYYHYHYYYYLYIYIFIFRLKTLHHPGNPRSIKNRNLNLIYFYF